MLKSGCSIAVYAGSDEEVARMLDEVLSISRISYIRKKDDEWFTEAVSHRLLASEMVAVGREGGQIVSVFSYDTFTVGHSHCIYISMGTVSAEKHGNGWASTMLRTIGSGYAFAAGRTQNPFVVKARIRAFGNCFPFTVSDDGNKLKLIASECARIIGADGYDEETMVYKNIYGDRSLYDKPYRCAAANHDIQVVMDSLVRDGSGDAVMVVSEI